ncbi:MAG: hypothetical protein Q9181_003361, partial [Wetmoreana brouardii]
METWLNLARSWERSRLNERPIYLRSLYLGLALVQTALHLYYDYDKMLESAEKEKMRSSSGEGPHDTTNPWEQLKSKLPSLLQEIGIIGVGFSIIGPIVYSFTLRGPAWQMSLFIARVFRWDVPYTQELSYIPPYHYMLIIRSLFSSVLLLLLWRTSNLAFSVYVAQEPLKRGQPLTQDSNDPNGSLINGLKAKKSVVKSSAYWELVIITRRYPERRVSIFRDIDRQGGAAWSQISSECLKTINGITTRIAEYGRSSQQQQAQVKPEDLQSLPRLAGPLREEPVFMNAPPPSSRREIVEAKVGSFAKSYGDKSVSSYGSPISPKAKAYLETARNKILTPEQQRAMTPANVQSQFNTYLTRMLRSRSGQPFRQTFARRIRSIAFGQPFSELVPIVNAVDALTTLATASLKEDSYGKVATDIPLIIRTFITTYETLERFAATLPPHWTDVEFSDSQRQTEDVRVMLCALKDGLRELVEAFGGFTAELGIEEKNIRVAKAIAGLS